jgi:hypothetical protein
MTRSKWEWDVSWATVIGPHVRRRGLQSPYMPVAEIVEHERGIPLAECFACRQFREDVRDVYDDELDGIIELCRACRQQHGVPDADTRSGPLA